MDHASRSACLLLSLTFAAVHFDPPLIEAGLEDFSTGCWCYCHIVACSVPVACWINHTKVVEVNPFVDNDACLLSPVHSNSEPGIIPLAEKRKQLPQIQFSISASQSRNRRRHVSADRRYSAASFDPLQIVANFEACLVWMCSSLLCRICRTSLWCWSHPTLKIATCYRTQCKHKHPLQSDVTKQYTNDGRVSIVHLHLMGFIVIVELPADALNFIDTVDISVVSATFIASHDMRLKERQSRRWFGIFNSQRRYLHSDQKFCQQQQSMFRAFVKTLTALNIVDSSRPAGVASSYALQCHKSVLKVTWRAQLCGWKHVLYLHIQTLWVSAMNSNCFSCRMYIHGTTI